MPGAKEIEGEITTNGTRILCATTLDNTVAESPKNAHELAKAISSNNMFYRAIVGEQN